jgi:diguanylate cyclase (GGDEF)-like protein
LDAIVMSVSPSRAGADAPVKDAVRFSRDQLSLILAALPDPAFILTRSGRYAALFGGADHRYYHDGSSLVGQSVYDVLAHDKAHWFAQEIEKALGSRALHIVEYSLAGSDVKGLEDAGPDHPIWFEGRVQALDFPVDGEDAVVWVASNITEKNAIEHQLRQQSETDPLTGLNNRRKLLDVLAIEFDLATRTRQPTCLLMFDVDNFKAVNDELGHSVGDELLATIATVCRRTLRSDDVLARLGGDEFVVLMPGTTSGEGGLVANGLRQQISLELQSKLALSSTISGGLTEISRSDTSIGDILRRADDGLYQSKRNGRNQITIV